MKTLLLLPTLILAGCTAPVAKAPTVKKESPPLTGQPMESVRLPEQLKAYPVGRYQDPNNPYVMHKGHTIYRAEQESAWNLAPNAPTAVPLGPTVSVSDPAQQRSPVTAELQQKIEQQNQLIAATIEQNDRLSEEIKKLQDDQGKAEESQAAQEKLQQELTQKETELAEARKREEARATETKEPVVPQPAPSWWETARNYFHSY